jgi:hypothetical protein
MQTVIRPGFTLFTSRASLFIHINCDWRESIWHPSIQSLDEKQSKNSSPTAKLLLPLERENTRVKVLLLISHQHKLTKLSLLVIYFWRRI